MSFKTNTSVLVISIGKIHTQPYRSKASRVRGVVRFLWHLPSFQTPSIRVSPTDVPFRQNWNQRGAVEILQAWVSVACSSTNGNEAFGTTTPSAKCLFASYSKSVRKRGRYRTLLFPKSFCCFCLVYAVSSRCHSSRLAASVQGRRYGTTGRLLLSYCTYTGVFDCS